MKYYATLNKECDLKPMKPELISVDINSASKCPLKI